jgi:peptidoglycan hydrolase-like protein with peptidoglycan-binding domain
VALLFPLYLDQGSKGPAVNILAIALIVAGYDPLGEIIFDGNYVRGGKIAEAVKRFQWKVSITADGNFGPVTRRAFAEHHHFNANQLTDAMFAGETVAANP